MKDQDGLKTGRQVFGKEASSPDSQEVKRAEEEGEAAAPDAPTAEEENAGMNTVLDAEPLFGVQDDASDE